VKQLEYGDMKVQAGDIRAKLNWILGKKVARMWSEFK
jgi:hypothetical protein